MFFHDLESTTVQNVSQDAPMPFLPEIAPTTKGKLLAAIHQLIGKSPWIDAWSKVH